MRAKLVPICIAVTTVLSLIFQTKADTFEGMEALRFGKASLAAKHWEKAENQGDSKK